MTCIRLPSGDPDVPDGFLCLGGPVYEYGGWLFEIHSYCGPHPLNRRTLEPRVNIPAEFWQAWEEFEKLPDEEREKYRKGSDE